MTLVVLLAASFQSSHLEPTTDHSRSHRHPRSSPPPPRHSYELPSASPAVFHSSCIPNHRLPGSGSTLLALGFGFCCRCCILQAVDQSPALVASPHTHTTKQPETTAGAISWLLLGDFCCILNFCFFRFRHPGTGTGRPIHQRLGRPGDTQQPTALRIIFFLPRALAFLPGCFSSRTNERTTSAKRKH